MPSRTMFSNRVSKAASSHSFQERYPGAGWPKNNGVTWIGLILLTLFHNWLSMVLFLKALKRLYAIQVALSNYLITFFGLPIAAIWLHERLTLLAVVGGIIVLCSTLLITLWEDTRAIKAERAMRMER